MHPVKQVQKKFGSRALAAAVIAALVFVLTGHKPIAKGLILGTLFSILNFVILGEIIPLQLAKVRRRLYAVLAGSLALRLGLLAVPLVLAIKTAWLDVAAVAAGLFMVQLMILTDPVFDRLAPLWSGKKIRQG